MIFTLASSKLTETIGSITNCQGANCQVNLPIVAAGSAQIAQVIQIVLAVLGAVGVLMLVVAGLRFVTGQGNPQEVAKARNTIIYVAIGLIIIATAEGIVAFTLGNL